MGVILLYDLALSLLSDYGEFKQALKTVSYEITFLSVCQCISLLKLLKASL
jgi:hypothetical protein